MGTVRDSREEFRNKSAEESALALISVACHRVSKGDEVVVNELIDDLNLLISSLVQDNFITREKAHEIAERCMYHLEKAQEYC